MTNFNNAPDALTRFLALAQPGPTWRRIGHEKASSGTLSHVELQSQEWRGEPWTHQMLVYEPTDRQPGNTGLLLVTGSYDGGSAAQLLELFSTLTGAPSAALYDVPNQPLFDELYEDAIIARTFSLFLESGDETWPLLFPMVRSVQSAMTALEECTAGQLQNFVVTGASKRGWTTWLTGSVDRRVIAIAPMVYNNLNIPAQMRRQMECFGTFSEEIGDYVREGLPERMETPEGMALTVMVDPFTQRAKLTLPKLLINGSNDRYWPLDAANLYVESLSGPTYQLMVPNAGHGLGDSDRVVPALAAFFSSACTTQSLPELAVSLSGKSWEWQLDLQTTSVPQRVLIWSAESSSLDFRESVWEAAPLQTTGTSATYRGRLPAAGFAAAYFEAWFENEGLAYPLSSPVSIVPGSPSGASTAGA